MMLFGVMLENRMNQAKKLYDSLNMVGSLTLAISIPWIIFRVFRAVYLQKNLNKLVGKVVVITGASSGLGEALAHEFYKYGCQVVLCARRRQELERAILIFWSTMVVFHIEVQSYLQILM
nr:unnamed protein product [Callosobruchus analis]